MQRNSAVLRVVPTWFHWTGRDLVMVTDVAGPGIGIRHPAARLAALRARVEITEGARAGYDVQK